MLLAEVLRFFSHIYVYYLLYSNILDVVHGVQNPVQYTGAKRSCAAYIRVSALTKPLAQGQSLFYDEPSNSLLFTDSSESSVYRYFIDSGRYYNITCGSRTINMIIPVEGLLDTYLIGYGNDLAILKWNCKSGYYSFRTLGIQDPSRPYPQNILGSAKVGPTQSRPVFFCSDPVPTAATPLSSYSKNVSKLYDIVNGKKKVLLSDFIYSKGLGFSSDGKTIFYIDYMQNKTFKASYNERTNSIENAKVLQDYSVWGLPGAPSTMTIDAQGYLWLCNQDNRLIKVNPDSGNVECAIKLPVDETASVVFAKCPKSKSNILNCIYVATRSYGNNTWNGRLLLIEGIHSTGILDYKVPLSTIYGHNVTAY